MHHKVYAILVWFVLWLHQKDSWRSSKMTRSDSVRCNCWVEKTGSRELTDLETVVNRNVSIPSLCQRSFFNDKPEKKGLEGSIGQFPGCNQVVSSCWLPNECNLLSKCAFSPCFWFQSRLLSFLLCDPRFHADWWEDSSRKEQGQVSIVDSVRFPWFLHISSLIKEPSVAPHCHVLMYIPFSLIMIFPQFIFRPPTTTTRPDVFCVFRQENLNADCAWVKINFDSRRTKRQAEIQGLIEAKGVLQAV